jgi:hypothetical protein
MPRGARMYEGEVMQQTEATLSDRT